MSGWEFLGQMLASRDEDKRQADRFKKQRELESQRSVDNASERAANIGAEADVYKKKREIDQEYSDKDAINAGKMGLARFFSSQGIDPELLKKGDEVFETTKNAYLSDRKAAAQKSATSQAEDSFKADSLAATRVPNINRLTSQAEEGAFRANKSKQFAENNPDALNAGMLGQELAPAAALAKANTMSVGPNEYLRRFTTGDSSFDRFFPGQEGQGATQGKQMVMQNIGGKQFPMQQDVTTPGSIRQTFSGKIPPVSSAAPRATGQQFGPAMPTATTGQQTATTSQAAQPMQQQGDLRDLPPHIAKLIEDPRYTPEAKQKIIQDYFNSLIQQAQPSMLDRFLSPDSSSLQVQEANKRRKLLSPNY